MVTCEVCKTKQRYTVEYCCISCFVKLERKAALVEELVTALSRLYTFPGVRDLLAPKESLGSIAAEVEVAIAKAEALIGPAKG
jgi:hypothetical protein